MLSQLQARQLMASCCKTIFIRAQDPDSNVDTMIRQLRQTADLVEQEMTNPTPEEGFPQRLESAVASVKNPPPGPPPSSRPQSVQQAIKNFAVEGQQAKKS